MTDLDSFWAKTLGCMEKDLDFNESKIVVKQEETDYNRDRNKKQIDIFEREANRIVSCSKEFGKNLEKYFSREKPV